MREASYTDMQGRQWAVLLPDDVPDSEAFRGLPIGPPPLELLDLPFAIEVRLHNELFNRRIFTARDARARVHEISAAIASACRLDAMTMLALFDAPSIGDLVDSYEETEGAILAATREDDPDGAAPP